MKHLYLSLIALFLLSSCSEDTTITNSSTNGGKPYLEVSPTSITISQYQQLDLKYRVVNFPYDGQVMATGNFGNGDTIDKYIANSSLLSYYYKEPGNYTISLSAYDWFADTLLDTKNIPVTVNQIQPTISISPANLDTAVTEVAYSLVFFNTNSSISAYPYNSYTWTVTGSGVNHIADYAGSSFTYNFSRVGTFTVTVRVKDYTTQKELAVDSTTVTIRQK